MVPCFLLQATQGQTLLFSDNLSTGAGWQYSHFGGTAKPGTTDISSADFGFDYSQLGIPEAPHSLPGDLGTAGLRLAANTPGLWAGDQIAAVYQDPSFSGQYTLQVDVWLNWAASPTGAGTTEHAGVLVGFNLADAQNSFAPGQNGAGVLFDSDGDANCGTGICDYMLVKDGAELDLASGQYGESSFGAGNQHGYDDGDSNANLNLQTLFPSFNIAAVTGGQNASGTQPAGSLGFQWVTVTLEVDADAAGSGINGHSGTVQVTLASQQSGNSFVLGTIDNSVDDNPFDGVNTEERPAHLEGGIGLMITDLYASGPSNPYHAFALFDNVRVYDGLVGPPPSSPAQAPESGTFVLLLLSMVFCGCFSPRRMGIQSMARRFTWLVLATTACCISCSPAWAVLNLTGNFDHGSLLSWSGDVNNINLVGRDNFFGGGQWRWMYFEASDVQGHQPVFKIDQLFAGGNSALNTHKMVYSYDNENWAFFDNNQRAGTEYTFSNNTPFTADKVYVAFAQPYSYGRSAAHAAQILATPWAEPTSSGDANGVIGQTPIAVDDLGRLNPKRDIVAYRITNPATDSATPKHKVVITTGLHAGEVLGTHTFEGLVNWLTSDDSRAARLRDDAEFFAYPLLNAAGRFAGYNRSTVENPDEDPNRIWHPTLWDEHQDIRAAGEAMLADVQSTPGTVVDAFIDFHSTIPASAGDDFGFIEISEGDANAPFWQHLLALQPNVQQVESTGTSWTSANFADLLLNADVDITFETEFGNNRPLSYYHTLGKNFGIAFYKAWVQVPNPVAADFDEDGDVDQADLAAWQHGFGTASAAEHHQGDADGDMDVDGADFLTWQTQYTGSISPLAASAPIPEPSGAVLLGIAISAILSARH
ncbi:MAG: hypothetical protein KDA57_08120 [Planctomycetales bacterium]|nr:hypothetical protein [Planctomycetales bacterium]